MSETVLDDRDPAITYVDGVWRKGGNSREYRETSSWSISNEATATIDFYGNSIRVIGTIHRRDGVPENATLNLAFVLQGESSSTIIAQNRARLEQLHPPKYSVQLYASPQLTDNSVKRQLVIRNLTPDNQGFLCLDAVYIGGYLTGPGPGQSESDPSSPSSGASTTSPSAPPPSTVTTSTSSESGSITSAPTTTAFTIPFGSSESSSVLFAPAATDESSSLSVEGGSDGGGSSRGDSNQGDPTSATAQKNRNTVTGVLGGLVGLLALGILCWFIFVRRRNKRRRAFGQDQQQKFAPPYSFGHSVNPDIASSAAGSETHLLNAIGRNHQNDHPAPLTAGAQMQQVFGGSGLSPVSAPKNKSAWNSITTRQRSGSGLARNSVNNTSRQEDELASPPPYTTSV